MNNSTDNLYSSGSSTPDLGYYKLPPIITTETDREFLNEVNGFIDSELGKINHLDEEQRYLVYKTVFNKVIEHVTAYKPVLVQIKKEYEDTIDTIKKGQREATFLQEKLKAMASEPSTLRNYRKRGDELEERISILKRKNDQLQQELQQIKLVKEEKEKRPKTAEKPERELKKDSRLIPGLSIEDSTDMKILHKKYETLDRQLKELSLSLRARFLPKTHKLQLKESLDNKVAYRDQLLWQSQVYKALGQRLKIALEAAQAYNQMKPPHQTVGDAVTIAFQQASGMLKAQREKTEGEQADAAQTTTFEDDDPNKEKEAEMMLEYIEKFNELFEDGLFEEAAVHAANSPKGILRTQATLAKFRDVKVKTKGRSPLLAFCDSIMSSVKAAGSKPNEALSMDCMEACLNENRLDLAYHWLSQDRLTQSVGLGKIISQHCSCPLPCKCGCQALAQSVFIKLKCHQEVVFTMLKQGKFQGALQYGRQRRCINDDNIGAILSEICNPSLVAGLMERDINGNKCLPGLNFGALLLALVDLQKTEVVSNLIQNMLKPTAIDGDATTALLTLETAVTLDETTTPDQWMVVLEALGSAGYQDTMYQLLAMTFVVEIVQQAITLEQEGDQTGGVSFSEVLPSTRLDSNLDRREEKTKNSEEEEDDSNEEGDEHRLDDDEDAKESSIGLSSRSRDDTSTPIEHSSRETSPEIARRRKQVAIAKESILKKKHLDRQADHQQDASSSECTPRKSPPVVRKRTVKVFRKKVGVGGIPKSDDDEDDSDDDDDLNAENNGLSRRVKMNLTPNSLATGKAENEDDNEKEDGVKSRVKFDDQTQLGDETNDKNYEQKPNQQDEVNENSLLDNQIEETKLEDDLDEKDDSTENKLEKDKVLFNVKENENELTDNLSENKKSGVNFEMTLTANQELHPNPEKTEPAEEYSAGNTPCESMKPGVIFETEQDSNEEMKAAESARSTLECSKTEIEPGTVDVSGDVQKTDGNPQVRFVEDCVTDNVNDEKIDDDGTRDDNAAEDEIDQTVTEKL